MKIILFLLIFFPLNNAMSSSTKHDTSHLTDIQKYVTLKNGTERPFANEYFDHKEEGIYVDVITGEALFSSTDKFDSGTGWPSFTKPIKDNIIIEKNDNSHGMSRIEVRSDSSDAHLGHVFPDGPAAEGGRRYCINSASLRFVAKDDLIKEGYSEYAFLFGYNIEKAILAGGCFWGMEDLFAKLDGVIDVKNGYTGGNIASPTYEIIRTGLSNHAESIEVIYDADKVSYAEILKFFFKIHDPTTLNRQGNDIGTQYRSAIFYTDAKQKEIAEDVIKQANAAGIYDRSIKTSLEKFNEFYIAEDYHQDYLEKNPGGYTCHLIRDEWEF